MQNKALFAAGCFWGIEAFFRKINGVTNVTCGYAGGNTQNPTYKDVCTGNTNHAEVVEIIFNTNVISYNELIKQFWECHDPCQINQQGFDKGTQYRSAIFYYDEQQKNNATNEKNIKQKSLTKNIATEITKFSNFTPAEEYHQRYLEKNNAKSCNS